VNAEGFKQRARRVSRRFFWNPARCLKPIALSRSPGRAGTMYFQCPWHNIFAVADRAYQARSGGAWVGKRTAGEWE